MSDGTDEPDQPGEPAGPGRASETGAPVADLDEWGRFAEGTPPPSRSRWRLDALGWTAVAIIVVTVVAMVLLRPGVVTADRSSLDTLGVPSDLHAAVITEIAAVDCLGEGEPTCSEVTFELTEGPDTGATYTQVFPPSDVDPDFEVGATAVLGRRAPNATVIGTGEAPCGFDPELTCRTVTVALDEVPGEPLVYVAGPDEPAAGLTDGDAALVQLVPDVEPPQVLSVVPPDVDLLYQFAGDFQRRGLLLWATVLFAVAVIAIGLFRGVAALLGLALSVGILLLFVLPAILDGRSPVLVAIVGATAIAIVSLYLAHGFTRMTNVALVGMVVALILTAALSAIAVELAHFTGFASEESTLLTLFEGIDVQGLLLAGIVLGTAGALDDVTVTQASAVWQLAAADPGGGRRTLFGRAMRIGRDHIASTVNTLLLAYAGAALPLFVLFVLSEQSLGAIANSEVVAVEIIRTLVGSIGLVAAVPITTWLATRMVAISAPTT